MRTIAHVTMALSLAVIISVPAEPVDPVLTSGGETILDRHHLLYGTVVPETTDAPFGTPGELYACISCHEVDPDTNQILVERDCLACHQSDRHHILYDTVIPDPTDAPYGASGDMFVCFSCHDVVTDSGSIEFPVERDCHVCHQPASGAPVAFDDVYTTAENTMLHVPAPGVLENDEGAALAATLHSDVSSGVLALLPTGSFQYLPDPGFVGDDQFTYVAGNASGVSNVAAVTIVVTRTEIKTIMVDVIPGSDRNPINLGSAGVLPVAIRGSAECDVTQIDGASLLLEQQVAPLRWSLKGGAGGYKDLLLKFDSRAVNDALADLQLGQTHEVRVTGELLDGTPIAGSDWIVVVALPRDDRGGKGEKG